MNKAMRWLALAGAGVAAGAMIGSSSAHAAPAAPQPVSATTGTSVQSWDYDDEYVFGPFRNKFRCNQFGWYGKKVGAWDRFYCYFDWEPGSGRGWFLKVDEDYWQWDDWDGFWDKGWPDRPKYIGGPLSFDHHKKFPYKHHKKHKKHFDGPPKFFH